MTEDEAKTYFTQLNPKSGELSDDELDNVAGGCSGSDSGPKKYYNRFEDGMNVTNSRTSCGYFGSTNCTRLTGISGIIRFSSDTEWTVTCDHCGFVARGSGNPADEGFLPS